MIHAKTLRLAMAASAGAGAVLTGLAATAQEAATTLNEVVVTAQKRSQNLQDVPAAVSVVSSRALAELHVTSLADIGAYVPGLQVTPGGSPGQVVLSLRGVYPVGSGTTVGTYIDDIPVGGSSLYSNAVGFSLDILPYDVSRIEVLSGPQGTLYGASTLGGLLKYALTEPDLNAYHVQVGGDVLGVSGGNSVGGGARASLAAPLVAGKVGVVASYAFEDTPGYIDDVGTGRNNVNAVRQQGGRFSVLMRPNDRLRIDLTALYQKVDADGLGAVALDPTTLKPLYGDLEDHNNLAQPFRKEITVLSARGAYDFGPATLTSITSYQYSDLKQVQDATPQLGGLVDLLGGLPAGEGRSAFDQFIQLTKYTEEIRLASAPNSHVEWLVGGFFDYEHSRLGQAVTAQDASGAFLPGLNPLETFFIPTIYREYAGFGDLTIHVTPKFDLAGGLRYAANNQNFTQVTGGTVVPPATVGGKSSEGVLTYSFNPSYRFNRDATAYVRIASGYQPGGPNISLPGVPPTVRSDTLTNYEVGLKTQWPALRASFNIDAFYIDWQNIQVVAVSDTTPPVGYIANGGTAKSEGVEAQGSFSPTTGLTLGGTFAYTDARYTQDVPSLSAHSGDPLPQTPRFSGSVEADYSHPLNGDWTAHLGGGLRLQSSRRSGNFQGTVFREPGYAALDLDADVSNGRYTLRLFAKNVTDERAYENITGIR
ncbi:MAG: TonB-dependent receptor, partial [Pseudomonadota bacterium]